MSMAIAGRARIRSAAASPSRYLIFIFLSHGPAVRYLSLASSEIRTRASNKCRSRASRTLRLRGSAAASTRSSRRRAAPRRGVYRVVSSAPRRCNHLTSAPIAHPHYLEPPEPARGCSDVSSSRPTFFFQFFPNGSYNPIHGNLSSFSYFHIQFF